MKTNKKGLINHIFRNQGIYSKERINTLIVENGCEYFNIRGCCEYKYLGFNEWEIIELA